MTLLKQYKRYYRLFREVSKVVHSTSDIHGVLELVVSRLVQGIEGKGAALCVLSKSSGHFKVRASHGISERYLALEPLAGTELLRWPESDEKIHFIRDIFRAPRVKYPKEAWEEGIRMILDVPLIIDGQVFGFIRLYFEDEREFSEDEIDFIWAVAEQSSCAINHDEEIQSHISQYQELATKVDRMSSLGRMAAGIAHEINNPLTGILLYSSNLFKKAEKGACRDGLEIIMQETQRCKKIIQGLLDFSREQKPQKVFANINKVIEVSLALMENELFIRRIKVIRDLDYDIDSFYLDDNQMEQVFINLFFNAAHAIGEKGKIIIRSRMDTAKNQVIVEVEDTGCGIPKDNLKKIFEPFYTTKSNGTGLGLAVSYGIVRNHQGTVKIFSEPDVGTVITLALPVLDHADDGE
ncbi:MAG: ATP-binding protein [Pseudomonadota bacterium]